jgi:peptidoglycan/LPS O-acetylase OafA/YrhL
MDRAPRRLPLRIAAGFFAFVFWLPSLALTDLVLGLIPDSSASSSAAGNVAYGVIGAVLIAPALASQVRRPERKIAPLQQIALVALALACAALASGEPVGVAGAVVVLIPLLVLLALHPDRRDVLRRPRRPSVPLLALALAAAVPALVYAWEVTANGRADLPPEDSFAYVPSLWSAAAGMALGAILVAVLAALRPPGWPVSAGCVAVAALLFGIASNINPDIAASGGRGWGSAAIVWSLAWIAVAARERASDAGHASLAEQDR